MAFSPLEKNLESHSFHMFLKLSLMPLVHGTTMYVFFLLEVVGVLCC